MYEKSLTNFRLPTPIHNNSNNIEQLEEVLRRPYDWIKLNSYIFKNESKLMRDKLFPYNSVLKFVFADKSKIVI